MLSDAQWAELEPLVEACHPKGKTPPEDLRRTLSAILWRHQNGARWRAIPEDLGPCWQAAQVFIRWAHAGVWESLLNLAQECGMRLGMVFLDGTNIRAPESRRCQAKRGSRAERDAREALGRSRGGYGTKASVIADGAGRAIAFRIAPGQAHEMPHAIPLLDRLPGVPKWMVGDRVYSSHGLREYVWDTGPRPAIRSKRNEAPVACPDWITNNRNAVERLWARLKEWRAVATRYEKTARSFLGVLSLAATIDWLKRWQSLALPGHFR